MGSFDFTAAPEASGIAASRRNPGLLYVLDDGPGTTSLVVLRARTGRMLGRLHVLGFHGTDTEDLAVARCAPGHAATCVFIGDIGDNLAARDSIELLRVREPVLGPDVPSVPVPAERAILRYPDRPHDAEALLVADDGSIGIVTKAAGRSGRGAARLYTTTTFRDGILRDSGRVGVPAPAVAVATAVVGNVVTGGDSVGGRVVLRTYDAIYEFHGSRGGALRDFPSWPVTQLAAPAERQGEAVAYGADGCTLFTVSEESGALTMMECR
ncbi:MAG: hypothetical protein GEU74_11650 [Nitriliruptorales bacterium]|nr:hypothetical protein [Nitriliruptorales bacterium]